MLKLNQIIDKIGDKGLASSQVDALRQEYGANRMTPPVRDSILKQYMKNFDDPIIKILMVAVVVSAVIAIIQGTGLLDTIAIVLAVMLATGIAFINEYRSNKEFDVLNAQRDEMEVKLIRNGHPSTVPSRDVVVGDLLILEAGDAIPADGWLLSSDDMHVDESAFTGESEPVLKNVEDHLCKGSFLTAGKGRALVGGVGDDTQMGVIAASLGMDHSIPTPLEEKLEVLAQLISKFGYVMAIGISVALFVKGMFIGEVTGLNMDTISNVLNYFMISVVIIVVAVPEGLPMSVALSLSLAMRKMTKANSLVRKMIACETIGSATTICTDKTGTLTKNQMEVVESSVKELKVPKRIPENGSEWITLNAAINSTAYLEERDGKSLVIGNSTEGALLNWLKDSQIDYEAVRRDIPIARQFLFDGIRKRMSTVVEIDTRRFLVVKGAPEIVAALCDSKVDLSGTYKLAARAMRTLGFAHREIIDGDESESSLIWDGYVGIRDHLREDVPNSIHYCQNAGISVRMVTGDNLETAKAIAKESGILNGGLSLTGQEFRALSDEKLENIATDIEVLARAEPMDKLRFVQALQNEGEVVAVTGDGTNDAPALKHADVGLSMGKSGTEVAREASSIILLDDSFPTITNAVWWGRALYENIQRFLQFQLTINFGACFIAFLAPLFGFPSPFTIIQLLWINLIMDTLAAIALCSEAPHEGLLSRPPIPKNENIITPYMWRSIIVTGLFYIVVAMVNMKTAFLGGSTLAEQSTVFFAWFVISQIWNGINCRAVNGQMPAFFAGNPTFFGIMGAIAVVQVLMVQFGGEVFGTVPLSLELWGKVFLYSASVLVVGLLVRLTAPSQEIKAEMKEQSNVETTKLSA
ncbi:MAG: calcium-translocating P-type ATPase, PMCA-type [Bacillota bacterium]|nr:calcium-translocating P-type ATPase, PMCA-type [Bacillota bacterium]